MATLRTMTIADYDAVVHLMRVTPGVSVRDADSHEATARYLARNPDLSWVAEHEGTVVACLMCGHDGRRGYLQHLVVHADHRRQGIARALVQRCLDELSRLGIYKAHVDVFKTNDSAHAYWASQGWTLRTDIDRYSYISNGRLNA